MPCTVISFMNRKGGVGKSTCVRLFASVACDRGLRVSCIDTDESTAVKDWHDAAIRRGFWHDAVSAKETMDEQTILEHVIASKESPEESICLIDTQGSSSEIMGMIFSLSDHIIIPTKLSRSDRVEVERIYEYIQLCREEGIRVTDPHILINVEARAGKSHKNNLSMLFDTYDDAVLDEMLPTLQAFHEIDDLGLLNVLVEKGPPIERKRYAKALQEADKLFDEVTGGRYVKKDEKP